MVPEARGKLYNKYNGGNSSFSVLETMAYNIICTLNFKVHCVQDRLHGFSIYRPMLFPPFLYPPGGSMGWVAYRTQAALALSSELQYLFEPHFSLTL